MADRLVIWLQRTKKGTPQILLKEPDHLPDADLAVDLSLDPSKLALLEQMKTGPWSPNLVEQVGTALCESLKQQPAIQTDFATRLTLTGPVEAPIYLWLDPPEVDDWPWEALSDPGAGFLALERRWPIARVKRVNAPTIKSEYMFLPPLRILAVLGASGSDPLTKISAAEEWRELYEAVRKSSLNVELQVYVCEDELLKAITDLKEPWITVGFLEGDRELFDRIKQFKPQLLHFFCHGKAETPPFLQIGTRLDWKRGEEGGINIEASQLRDRADPDQNVWLVTLNCCESAQAAGTNGSSRSRPMASSLVLSGFPAVVGMRQRVESEHAHCFCGLWYETLLRELKTGLEKEPATPFHWAIGLFEARQGICSKVEKVPPTHSARRHVEWTIPVIYTRYQPFTIRLAKDPAHPLVRPMPPPAPVPAPGAAAAPPVAAAVPVPAPPAAPPPTAPPAAAPAAAAPIAPVKPSLSIDEKMRLISEMQGLLNAKDKLAAQDNIPPAVRKSVLDEIDTKLASIEAQLT